MKFTDLKDDKKEQGQVSSEEEVENLIIDYSKVAQEEPVPFFSFYTLV
jgi:hypothetical protein